MVVGEIDTCNSSCSKINLVFEFPPLFPAAVDDTARHDKVDMGVIVELRLWVCCMAQIPG